MHLRSGHCGKQTVEAFIHILYTQYVLRLLQTIVYCSIDEYRVEQHLQAKQRCQNYSQYGSIQWKIDEGLFTKRYTDVIFYYFNLNQNEIIGSSTKLTVINPSAVNGFQLYFYISIIFNK